MTPTTIRTAMGVALVCLLSQAMAADSKSNIPTTFADEKRAEETLPSLAEGTYVPYYIRIRSV